LVTTGQIKSASRCPPATNQSISGKKTQYLCQWLGLPVSEASWEFPNAISTVFDPTTYAEQLPDLSGVSDKQVMELLNSVDNQTLHTRPLQAMQPELLETVVAQPAPEHRTIPLVKFVFPTWDPFMPRVLLQKYDRGLFAGFIARFDSGLLPLDLRDDMDIDLASLLPGELISDHPLHVFGVNVVNNTPSFDPLASAHCCYYVDPFMSSNEWTPAFESPVEGFEYANKSGSVHHQQRIIQVRCTRFILFCCNVSGLHWIAIVWSKVESVWLILDSICRLPRTYVDKVRACSKAMEYLSNEPVHPNAKIIVSMDWPQQGGEPECGIFVCLAAAFVMAHGGEGRLVENMTRGVRVPLPPFPYSRSRLFRSQLYAFCRTILS